MRKAYRSNHVSCLLFILVLIPCDFSVTEARQPDQIKGKYEMLIESDSVRDMLSDILADPNNADVDLLGDLLSIRGTKADAVLDTLGRNQSVEAATLRGELLVWMARGDEMPMGKRKSRETEAEAMSTDDVGRHAAELLDHRDPVVRGLAEWAIAIRLGVDYEGAEERIDGRRMVKTWPGDDAPQWYRKWEAINADDLLDLDYVRQLVSSGLHRNTAGLLESAKTVMMRVKGLAGYIGKHGGGDIPARVRMQLAEVQRAYDHLCHAASDSQTDLTAQRELWLALRHKVRQLILSSPDLTANQILFVTRPASPTSGNITAGRWNTHAPGGDILIKTGLSPSDPTQPLIDGRLGPGHVRGLDLWWDADRIVFAFVRQPGMVHGQDDTSENGQPDRTFGGYFGLGTEVEEGSNLYEMNIDGSGLRRLTNELLNVDQEPAYLPGGDIVFVSDRSFFGSQCAGALEQDNMILNLYRCDRNGANVRPLSNNKDFDRHPHMMDNGQLLFLHWEYQERHLWQTHSLWTCRPDGAMTDAIYKQHIDNGPMSLREARQVFGQNKLVAIACGHHNWDQGAVVLADYAMGINEKKAMSMITPGVSSTEGGYGGIKPPAEGGVQDNGGHYMYPYPLSDRSFLVSYSYKRPENTVGRNFSLYYIDVWGNKELIHRDRKLSVAYLMPLRKAPRPPILEELPPSPSRADQYALALVTNVHAGWPEELGERAKYIRISQKVPWPCVPDETKACGFNDLHWMPSAWEPVLGMWDWGAARVIGTVPVEADGSAYFKVPVNQTVYFHALDENYLELRRMRSNVTFMAGETRSCIGCHESKAVAPPANHGRTVMALRREPSIPVPPPWGDRRLPDFERDIQPIFESHCVRCHGQKEPAGDLDFTATRIDGYLQSYRTLFGLKTNEPTPFVKGYWAIWRPDEPKQSDEAYNAAKTFLRNIVRKPESDQLLSLADYMGGPEVTQLLQFGSGVSRLTLTLLNDDLHQREVEMSLSQWLALVTWIDVNAQYWGTFVEKDGHYESRLAGGQAIPPRRVHAIFPDPWTRPPAGQWIWKDKQTVVMKP